MSTLQHFHHMKKMVSEWPRRICFFGAVTRAIAFPRSCLRQFYFWALKLYNSVLWLVWNKLWPLNCSVFSRQASCVCGYEAWNKNVNCVAQHCGHCVNLIASPLPSGRKYFERGQGAPLISCLQTEAPTAEQHRQNEKWEEGGFSEHPGPTAGIQTTVQISIVNHWLLLFLAYYLFILCGFLKRSLYICTKYA